MRRMQMGHASRAIFCAFENISKPIKAQSSSWLTSHLIYETTSAMPTSPSLQCHAPSRPYGTFAFHIPRPCPFRCPWRGLRSRRRRRRRRRHRHLQRASHAKAAAASSGSHMSRHVVDPFRQKLLPVDKSITTRTCRTCNALSELAILRLNQCYLMAIDFVIKH